MHNEQNPPGRGCRIPAPGQNPPPAFILIETVTGPMVLPNDATCNPAFVSRFNDRSAPRSRCREARR
jgi:hypothetical protein